MIKKHYVLLEGLPGSGKTTLIEFLRGRNHSFSLLPDYGNPKDLAADFMMDYSWIIDIESQKSRLALRAKKTVTLQERGYLSILACHYMLQQLQIENNYEKVLEEICNNVKNNLLIIPETIVISTISPTQSRIHQPGTKLEMWQNVEKLKLIQEYYLKYAEKPLFGERIITANWENLRNMMQKEWEFL